MTTTSSDPSTRQHLPLERMLAMVSTALVRGPGENLVNQEIKTQQRMMMPKEASIGPRVGGTAAARQVLLNLVVLEVGALKQASTA